jgi:putative RecB family exonuclease
MSILHTPHRGPPSATPPAREYLSFSAVNSFAGCPLRYFFRYVAGLPEEIVSSSLLFGSAFHAAVEHHFRELLAGNASPGLDVLLGVFWDGWQRNAEGRQIQFPRTDDVNTLGRMAERMLVAFQRSSLAHPVGTIIGVEEEVRGVLIPGLPDLLARVDLLVDTGDALTVTDFKTSRSSWSEDHVTESAGQLLLYHELVKEWAGGRPVRLAFAVVSKTKSPEAVLHNVPVDPQQIDRTKRVVERIWRAIQAGNFYPVPTPLNCTTCPYRQPCRDWRG